jgi:hypothetical protein
MSVPLVAVTTRCLICRVSSMSSPRPVRATRDHAVRRAGARSQSGTPRRIPRIRSLRCTGRRALNRIVDEARQAWQTHVSRCITGRDVWTLAKQASSSPRRHRTVHTRSRRADTPSSASNRSCQSGNTSISPRGCVARRRHRRSEDEAARRRPIESHARNDPTVCAAQGLAGSGELVRTFHTRDRPNSVEDARDEMPRSANTSEPCPSRSTPTTRDDCVSQRGDEVAFLPPFPAANTLRSVVSAFRRTSIVR